MLRGIDFASIPALQDPMGRSSTTFSGKWHSGKTTVVRVPQILANRVIEYARELDTQANIAKDPEAIYRTAAHVELNQPINVAAVPHRSPFRYPGGKTWLVPYVRSWLSSLRPRPQLLIEPFAGGGIVGLTAGIERLADHVILVEKDADVAAVWKVILSGQAEWLAQRIEEFSLTKANVLTVLRKTPRNPRERAFATIIRNRVQRGGIMAAGAGLVRNGENGRGLSSRWYPQTLAERIRTIAEMRERFSFIEGDGMEIIQSYAREKNAAFFVDPPYTVAARRLYSHWQVDQRTLFNLLRRVEGSVLLTYDSTVEISDLAVEFGFETQTVAMKNTHHARMTELLVGKDLTWLRLAQASPVSRARTAQVTLAFPQ
jgi:DNA adenine methylase